MADSSPGPAILRIAIGFAIGAAIGFTVANNMSPSRPAPTAMQAPVQATDGATGATDAEGPTGGLSDEELRRAMAAVDARPDDFEAQFKMGEALLRISRRPSDAIRYYERAVGIQPKNAEALVGLGDANFATALEGGNTAGDASRLDAARAAYERAIVVAPGSAGVHAALGSTYALRKPPVVDKARASFERALAIDPQNALARRGLADLGVPATNGNTSRLRP